jgi:hypothetical protein
LHAFAADREGTLFLPINCLPPTILDGFATVTRLSQHDYCADLLSLRFLAFCPFLRHDANGGTTLPRSVVQLGNFISAEGMLIHIGNTGGVMPLLEGLDCRPEQVAFINLFAGEAASPRGLQGIDFFPPLASAIGQLKFFRELLPPESCGAIEQFSLLEYARSYESRMLSDYLAAWEQEQLPRLQQQGMDPAKIDAFRAQLEAHIRAAAEKRLS